MAVTTITIPADSDYGKKPYVALITGTHPKMGYERKFLASHTVTACGVYECSARKGKKLYYAVLRHDNGDLVRAKLGDETLALLVSDFLDRMEDVAPEADPENEGRWILRRDGKILTRTDGTTPKPDPTDVLKRAHAFILAVRQQAKEGGTLAAPDMDQLIADIETLIR